LAISIPHQLIDIGGGTTTETDEDVALELVTKAKKEVDSGLSSKYVKSSQRYMIKFSDRTIDL
jgi:hypothetical protein